ncbi:MAG TPA: TadE family protein, partial [Anaerolineales bacterium]|nr:TadE family protein [Anaerolineales bacterium]
MNTKTQNSLSENAQAIVEFAIVAPILFLMLFGIFEVGRMVYVYSAVTNSSREAVRYGSAVGYDDNQNIKYKNCVGIQDRAVRSAYFLNLQPADIVIQYDHGPGTAVFHTCTPGADGVDPGYFLT